LAGELVLLDGATGRVRWHQAAAHPGGVLWIAFHPTEPLLASGGQDGAVRLWHADKGEPISVLFEERRRWSELGAWSAEGVLAFTSAKDLLFYKADGTALGRVTPFEKSSVAALAWHPVQPELAVGGFGGLSVWKAGEEKPISSKAWPTSFLATAWKPQSWENEWVAGGTGDASVEVWKVGSDEALRMAGYAGKVRELAWHTGGEFLSTAGGPNIVCWDFRGAGPEGSAPQEWIAHSETVAALATHPTDATRVASSGRDQLIFIWQLGKDDPISIRAVPESVPHLLTWKPDGTGLAAGCEGGEVVFFKI
jgi:WD40 repeat protein